MIKPTFIKTNDVKHLYIALQQQYIAKTNKRERYFSTISSDNPETKANIYTETMSYNISGLCCKIRS